MLNRIANVIIEALTALSIFRKVDLWVGDMDALVNQPNPLPSAYVVLTEGAFSKSRTIPDTAASLRMQWNVLLFFDSISESRISGPAGYGLIEAVSGPTSDGGLSGLVVDDLGALWPTYLELVLAKNGVCVYSIGFYMDSECTGAET